MTSRALVWTAVAFVAMAVFLLPARRDDVRTLLAEQNAVRVALAHRQQVGALKAAQDRTNLALLAVASSEYRVRRVRDDLVAESAESRRVLADSLATADTLRAQLARQVAVSDSLVVHVDSLLMAVDTLQLRLTRERKALTMVLAQTDSLVGAKDAVIASLKAQSPRWYERLVRVGCSAAGGGLGAVLGAQVNPKMAGTGAVVGVVLGAVACR